MWIAFCATLAAAQVDGEAASMPVQASEEAPTAVAEPVEAGSAEVVSAAAPSTAAERARNFVRYGDELGQRGQRTSQLRAYRRALELDPTLANDRDFVARFQQTYVFERRGGFAARPFVSPGTRPVARPAAPRYFPEPRSRPPRAPAQRRYFVHQRQPPLRVEQQPLGPRQRRYIGAGAFVGPQALAGVGLTSYLFQHLQISVVGDFWLPAITIDAKVHFLRFNISPYIGAGAHLALPVKGLDNPPAVDLWRTGFLYVTTGVQWMTDIGFFVDAGISIVPGANATPGRSGRLTFMPSLSLGWAWRTGR